MLLKREAEGPGPSVRQSCSRHFFPSFSHTFCSVIRCPSDCGSEGHLPYKQRGHGISRILRMIGLLACRDERQEGRSATGRVLTAGSCAESFRSTRCRFYIQALWGHWSCCRCSTPSGVVVWNFHLPPGFTRGYQQRTPMGSVAGKPMRATNDPNVLPHTRVASRNCALPAVVGAAARAVC